MALKLQKKTILQIKMFGYPDFVSVSHQILLKAPI